MRVVICGAGTAGCVPAARLTEDPGVEVTLLERGPHYRPGRWPAALAHSHRIVKDSHDWGYLARAGASPRLVHVPRGQVVGGSSVTNGAIALRGHPEHYDEWDRFVDGYGWESWLPWFRRIERDLDFGGAPLPRRRRADRGQPLPARPSAGVQERFCEAALAPRPRLGGRPQPPGALGIGPVPLNMIDGGRQTPADHYLDPALGRPEPAPGGGGGGRPGARCRRPGVRGGGRSAAPGGRRLAADAVIVALGAYATPAALLRSGIGPARGAAPAHGDRGGHPLAGVGRGMQDHPKVSYRFDLRIAPPPAGRTPGTRSLLTGAHEVAGRAAGLPGDALLGPGSGGQRFTDLNVQLSDARSPARLGAPAGAATRPLQPRARDGLAAWSDSDRAAARAAGERLLELAGAPPLAGCCAPGRTSPTPTTRCARSRPSTTRSAAAGWAARTTRRPWSTRGGRVLGLEGLWVIDASVIPRRPLGQHPPAVIALAERLAAAFPAA